MPLNLMDNSQSQFHFCHTNNELHQGLCIGAGEVRLATRDEITQTEIGKGEETSLWNVIEIFTIRKRVREGNIFSRVCLFTALLPSPSLPPPPGLSPGPLTIQGPSLWSPSLTINMFNLVHFGLTIHGPLLKSVGKRTVNLRLKGLLAEK